MTPLKILINTLIFLCAASLLFSLFFLKNMVFSRSLLLVLAILKILEWKIFNN